MKAIEMNQALMEAIKTTEVLGASALEETRALRQLVASANARIEEQETAAVEEVNHPVAALVAAFQQEEFTPLLIVQLHNVKRGCGGTEISKADG